MQLSDIFLGLGEPALGQLMRSISIGRLKTYQLYERLKTRMHVAKLNTEILRKSAPRAWKRLNEKDDEFASDLSQAILISHMDMIQDVLNYLNIPNEDGFFAKDFDASKYLKENWRQEAYEHFHDKYDPALLLFYINHLAWEAQKSEDLFVPAAQGSAE